MSAMRKSGILMLLAVLCLFASAAHSVAQTYTGTDLGTTFTTLHSFDGTDGSYPFDALTQATDGTFYGTTSTGGAAGAAGTVFSLSMGFGPFVKASPTSGKVGASVRILGTNLTGATSVTFHGTAASFTTISASEIKATVPSGATTGKIQVVTPGGTLLSNVSFRVP